MTAFFTGLIGAVIVFAALFFAFGTGVEWERGSSKGWPAVISLTLALIGIILLLLRS